MAPASVQLVTDGSLHPWTGERIFFWIIAAVVIGGALFTISRKNAVAAVMSLVAVFFGLAAFYALLSAHFLAALQVLVYAGAIMVLFIFVVMVLNRDETDRVALSGVILKVFGAAAIGGLAAMVGRYLLQIQPEHPEAPPESFGTVADVGHLLFTDYLFAFEAVSVLLLIAVVAAVVVARAHKHESATPHAPEPGQETHG
jgi:NADH-quinone oxidoreductase subunit J